MGRRWLLPSVAATAVVLGALLARVDIEAPELAIERPAPEPAPTAVADDREHGPEWTTVGAWQPMAISPIGPRSEHVAVWTGLCSSGSAPRSCGELLAWGGYGQGPFNADGAAYHPPSDSWRRLAEAPRGPPQSEALPAVWTGARLDAPYMADADRRGELVLWGATGADLHAGGGGPEEPRGVAYDPVADTWRTLPAAPIEPRVGHSLAWTGTEVIVWGGRRPHPDGGWEALRDGAAYHPGTDAWRALPDAPLTPRHGHAAVALPSGKVVVLGGLEGDLDDPEPATAGAVYDPAVDDWAPIPPLAGTFAARLPWSAVARDPYNPAGVVALAPLVDDERRPLFAAYDLAKEAWHTRPAGPVGVRPDAYVESGRDLMVVWGETPPEHAGPSGAVRYPRTHAWRLAPEDRDAVPGETATWTGIALLTWGGGREGAIWDPYAQPAPAAPPHDAGEARRAELPPGHETNWRLSADEAVALTVTGPGASSARLWLSAGREAGGRARVFEPAVSNCGPERCWVAFDQVPALLPGLLRLHLEAGDDGAAVEVTVLGL